MYRLRTLGGLTLERGGTALDEVGTHRKALALLAILAAQGGTSREWPTTAGRSWTACTWMAP